jgi:hypothetical protein
LSDGDLTLALTAEEREALIGLLRRAIDDARYPYSRRYNPIKAILAKLDRRRRNRNSRRLCLPAVGRLLGAGVGDGEAQA